jgi:hypothetical protein
MKNIMSLQKMKEINQKTKIYKDVSKAKNINNNKK